MKQQHQHPDIFVLARGITVLMMMLSPVNLTASSAPVTDTLPTAAAPTPELEPADVVRIQVEALRGNSPLDEGIELTYRFASPSNKRVTGPLARFRRMIKGSAYSSMLNHKIAEYGPLKISGNTASQQVTIIEPNGKAAIYLFELSKQMEAPCKGCWMTDSVTIIPTRRQEIQGA